MNVGARCVQKRAFLCIYLSRNVNVPPLDTSRLNFQEVTETFNCGILVTILNSISQFLVVGHCLWEGHTLHLLS